MVLEIVSRTEEALQRRHTFGASAVGDSRRHHLCHRCLLKAVYKSDFLGAEEERHSIILCDFQFWTM
jgi:hypothetical protein